MLQVKLDTGFNIEVDFAISPFHKRFAAWAIDVMIFSAWFIIGYRILSKVLGNGEKADWVWAIYGLPVLLYHLLCEVFLNGQSIGKKAMGIKVIAIDGGQPSFSQYLIRWLFRSVDFPTWILAAVAYDALPWWCAILLGGGLACLLFTPYSQRIGDLVAGTIIISTRTRATWQDTVFTELETNYQPRYSRVLNLSDKDVNTLKSIIDVVRKKNDYDLATRIAERIKSRLQIESDQDALEFLITLLKDYNYFTSK
jgi:uncharacterized RDD family membrane protein YckC